MPRARQTHICTAYLIASLGCVGLRRSSRSAGHGSTIVGDGLLPFGYVAHNRTAGELLVNVALGLGSRTTLDGLSLAGKVLLLLGDLGDHARLDSVVGHLGG